MTATISRTGSLRRVARLGASTMVALVAVLSSARAIRGDDNYKRTDSGHQYSHHLTLYDALGQEIDPTAPLAQPYSPKQTCRKCHDYAAIECGNHSSVAASQVDGAARATEPWWWVDARSGSVLPLSYGEASGTFRPESVGMNGVDFVREFGRHMVGGMQSIPAAVDGAERARRALSGDFEVDCMVCHSADRSYSIAARAKQLAAGNFAWAPTVALGLAKVQGHVDKLADDATPDELPKTVYDARRFDRDGQVFFDVLRRPTNNACYACHSQRATGETKWQHDRDVHLRAGLSCVDCHRNGIDHKMTRGYPAETREASSSEASSRAVFSCEGCHLADARVGGGRFGSPKPKHAGLPPIHLQAMSCTSCHSGRGMQTEAGRLQTARAHALGLPSQTRRDDDLPAIVSPVYRKRDDGRDGIDAIAWPAYWAWQKAGGEIEVIAPTTAARVVRRALRVRKNLVAEKARATLNEDERVAAIGAQRAKLDASELTSDERVQLDRATAEKRQRVFREALARGLAAFEESAPQGASAIYVSSGRGYRLATDGSVETFVDDAFRPLAWPRAHNVQPARWALGVDGCDSCHSEASPFMHGRVTANGPVPEVEPLRYEMSELLAQDSTLIAAWERSFGGRDAFKWGGLVALGCVVLILLVELGFGFGATWRRLERRLAAWRGKRDGVAHDVASESDADRDRVR